MIISGRVGPLSGSFVESPASSGLAGVALDPLKLLSVAFLSRIYFQFVPPELARDRALETACEASPGGREFDQIALHPAGCCPPVQMRIE
jgi:hypothetical protein